MATDLLNVRELEQARELHDDTLGVLVKVARPLVLAQLRQVDGEVAGRKQRGGVVLAKNPASPDQLNRRRLVLGDDHFDTLTSVGNLADDLRLLGEYRKARELNEDTLSRCRRVLGEDAPSTLTVANNLALDLFGLGEYRQARELHDDTLTRRRRVFGDDHPSTWSSAGALADALQALGEHQQAEGWRAWANQHRHARPEDTGQARWRGV